MARIYIGAGSNIDREYYIRAGWLALQQVFPLCVCSAVYESAAVGFPGDPFYNCVIEAETSLSVTDVAAALRQIEFAHGRPLDARKFSGRTLDLDLLAYDQVIMATPVQLPRYEIQTNAFVLRPFAELAPSWCHPVLGVTLAELWQRYDATIQPLRQIDFLWTDG